MKAALDILTAAPEFDLVLAVVGSSARFHPELAVQAGHRQRRRGKADRGIPGAGSAGGAGRARRGRRAELPHAGSLRGRHRGGAGAACAEADGRASARQRRAAACSTSWKPMRCSTGSASRAPRRSRSIRRSHSRPALPFPYPVAVKVLSADIRTRPNAAASRSMCAMRGALLGAIRQIDRARSRSAAARADRVLVAPMVAGIGEALIGYRVDREVGPLIMVAAGGVLTEIYRDRSLRLAPVDLPSRACHDRRGEGLRDAERLSRQAGRRPRGAGASASWRCRSSRCRMIRRSPRPRSIR